MPSVSVDCLLVGFAVFVLAAINIGVARSVDRHLDTAKILGRMDRAIDRMDRSLEHMDHAVERMDQSTAACNRAADACQSMADAMRLMVQEQIIRDRPQPGPAG